MQVNDFPRLAALDLARQIEAGKLTPAAVLERCAAAIAAHEEAVCAFASLDIQQARKIAERDGGALSVMPLRGLPIGIKDVFDTTDFPTEYGSTIYACQRPDEDATLVCDVREAGGIILGKTVTTEFAYFSPGRTRNPHALGHTPGGSSSGSAAAVAAGMLPIAISSQTGGSTIRPAAFCGIAGLKPSFGLLPTTGMKGMAPSLDTAGLMAVTVPDVAFAFSAISGRDYCVHNAAGGAPRLLLARTSHWSEASDDMQEGVEMGVRAASAAGARIRELILPAEFEKAYQAHTVIQGYEAHRAMAWEYGQCRNQLSPVLREALEEGAAVSETAYHDAQREVSQARQVFEEITSDADALITASALGAAPEGLESIGTSQFNRLWTLLGTPCINVPGFVDRGGLPLGIQIVARCGDDLGALLAAHFVERAIARYA